MRASEPLLPAKHFPPSTVQTGNKPSKSSQVVHIQSQVSDRRQDGGGSGGEQVPAVRVLCAQLRQAERGEPGDAIRPSLQEAVYGACGARALHRLHR